MVVGSFFNSSSFLPVSVQALSTPAPNRPVHLQDLTVIAMTMGEQMKNNPRKHNRTGWQLRQAKWTYEWKKPGNNNSETSVKSWKNLICFILLVVLVELVWEHQITTLWLIKPRFNLWKIQVIISMPKLYCCQILRALPSPQRFPEIPTSCYLSSEYS